jgi:hypothetical protein
LRACSVGNTGIYGVRRSHGLRWHDIHTKLHKERFRCSNVVKGETHTQTAIWSHKPIFMFYNKKNKLQNYYVQPETNITRIIFYLSSNDTYISPRVCKFQTSALKLWVRMVLLVDLLFSYIILRRESSVWLTRRQITTRYKRIQRRERERIWDTWNRSKQVSTSSREERKLRWRRRIGGRQEQRSRIRTQVAKVRYWKYYAKYMPTCGGRSVGIVRSRTGATEI